MPVTIPKQRCSALARESEEPLFGTAPTSAAWMLVESEGPWGADALMESSIPPEVAAELSRRSKAHGFRVLLLRRNAGTPDGDTRSCFLVRSAQGQTWMERMDVDSPAALLDVDPETLSRPDPPGLGETTGPLWAVCTHGRRDPCCAEYGRRLVRLGFHEQSLQECLWESSHQGGHRFAANLALFPHGLFYGQVQADDVRRIVEAYQEERVVLDGYRGRSSFNEVTQAAEYLVRRQISLTGIDDLVPEEQRQLAPGRYQVTFNGNAGRFTIRLEESEGPMRPESCNKPKLTRVKLFSEIDVQPDIGPAGFPTV